MQYLSPKRTVLPDYFYPLVQIINGGNEVS